MAALTVFAVTASLNLSTVPASAATAAMPYDFDGDGDPDLVVGVPQMRIGSAHAAGAVVVLPASAGGVALSATLITQASPGVPGAREAGDGFGGSVASADFNWDGYADLAVGALGESVGRKDVAGSVTVMYGSARGLDTSRSVWIGRPGGSAQFALWGKSLVAADFNADGYPDLAVGASDDPVGTVRVLPGGAGGLRTTGVRVLGPEGGPSEGPIEFGGVLAAGDLDGDGSTDLVVGARGEELGNQGWQNASVSYCPGTASGPDACRRLAWGDDYAGLSGIAVGNMSGGALPEIAVGVPALNSREPDVFAAPGRVHVLELSAGPPTTIAHRKTIMQSSAGVPGSNEDRDAFGSTLALGDLDDDGYADLVVGAHGENSQRGRVTVVHGASTGWRTRGNCYYSQNTLGVPGVAEPGDGFGSALTLLDHDRDGHLDLTVGAPGENVEDGAITTLPGSSGCGFTANGSRTFSLARLGYPNPWRDDEGEPGWSFGSVFGRP